MKSSRDLSFVFSVGVVCILSTLTVTFYYGRQVMLMNRQVLAHSQAIQHLETFLSTLKDAETGQRGYVLTGEEKYLGPYEQAVHRVQGELEAIGRINMNGESRKVAASLASDTSGKFEELNRTIDARKNQGLDAALAIVRSSGGRETMDRIRAGIARLKGEEEVSFEESLGVSEIATQIRTAVFIAAGVVNLGFLGWAFGRIRNEISKRDLSREETLRERDEVRKQKELLNVTLSSIGDCVIVTDTEGRITFMNVVAEELTGWKFGEAQKEPVANVFRIINEYSRESVESPVEKVLKLGQIVGLANHTLLIRKDGSEVPIDDSGSPIRDMDGRLRGVVLVFRDFTEYKNSESMLESAKQAAENANRAKDQFLAMLSHELRTPLTPVLATFSVWEMNNAIPESLKEDVKMLRHNIELEARLIDDLLDLTRIVKGILHLTFEVSDIHDLLESVVTMYTSEIQGKGIQLDVNLEAAGHHARVDSARVQQVFWNVLKNATKFTDPGGAIRVTTSNDAQGNVVITFIDTGIGITKETLSRLFLPFEQGEHNITHRYEGLGLGLAISKALVDAQNGTIAATSAGKGAGATLTISFPAVEAANRLQSPAGNETHISSPAKTGLKILLLEDHTHTVQVMSRILTGHGHDVRAVSSIKSAVDIMHQEKFDLLLCDIGLPDGTGMDFLKKIRQFDQTPAVALSGFGMEEDIARCEAAGFFAHLTKPIDLQRLDALIRNIPKF